MLDKFLNKVNSSSEDNSIQKKVMDYNREVLANQKPVQRFNPTPELVDMYLKANANNGNNKFDKFKKSGSQFSNFEKPNRPNTYQTYDNKKQPKEYVDDGSYFCSYAIGGNTLVCFKNKEKIEFVLDGINHPDKNNYLAKRANYFLNDLVKKQKVYITEKDNGLYDIFLDSEKSSSINESLVNEGFHTSVPYNANSKDKKTSFNKNTTEIEQDKKNETKEASEEIKEKKNYAYGLFATNHNTFEALFNKNKITLKLNDLKLDFISKEDQKVCKSMIYDFVSKKSIILKFIKEENGIHFVEVFNKEGESLNSSIEAKNFKCLENPIKNNPKQNESETVTENEQLSANEWDWASNNDNPIGEKEVHDNSELPAMFKKTITSKPNSPFAKKQSIKVESNSEDLIANPLEDLGEEINVPDMISLPAMFRKPVSSNSSSPFAKKITKEDSESVSITNETPKKKLSFGKR